MSSTPRIWSKFTVKSKDGDLKLRLQDITPDLMDDAADLFKKYFATQEAFHKAAGVFKNEDATEERKEYYRYRMGDSNTFICCVDDDTDSVGQIIAVSMMEIKRKDDPETYHDVESARTEEVRKYIEIVNAALRDFNEKNESTIECYHGVGVVVHPDYRGLGIAQKMFNTRRIICKEEDIPITGAWCTVFGTQKAAERDGWETAFEACYQEMGNLMGVQFEDVPPTCKYMIAKAL